MSFFKRMDYSCHLNQHIKGAEFDIVGDRKQGWLEPREWILAECKNKPKVVLDDFNKFLGKFRTFEKGHGDDEVYGYLVTSGVFDPTVKSAKRAHSEIILKRIRA